MNFNLTILMNLACLFFSLTMINKDAMKNESVIANADMMRYEVN